MIYKLGLIKRTLDCNQDSNFGARFEENKLKMTHVIKFIILWLMHLLYFSVKKTA
jgi:hypothetical protein